LWAMGYRGSRAERDRHHRVSFWLSVSILPLLVTAHSTLGFIFGIQSGRPGWFGALQAPAFVILAGVSGTGMVILALLVIRWLFGVEDKVPPATFQWLANFMSVLALVYLYFTVVEELTATYAAPSAEREVAHLVTGGVFASAFWVTIGCLGIAFVVPFVAYVRSTISLVWIAVAAVAANVAAVVKRMLIVVPSQTHGALLPLERGSYWANWIEIGVIVGLFGVIGAAILLVGRVFPLIPTGARLDGGDGDDEGWRRWLRTASTAVVATGAACMIAFGLADSFRLFRPGELDPVVPYSPVIFAGGVMLLFCSAIVYEAFPGGPPDRIATGPGDASASETEGS